jgi:hypothetical protein
LLLPLQNISGPLDTSTQTPASFQQQLLLLWHLDTTKHIRWTRMHTMLE